MNFETFLSMTGLGITYSNGILYGPSGQLATPQQLSTLVYKLNQITMEYSLNNGNTATLDALMGAASNQSQQETSSSSSSGSGSSPNNNIANAIAPAASAPQAPGGVMNTLGTYAGYTAMFNSLMQSGWIQNHTPDWLSGSANGGGFINSAPWGAAMAAISLFSLFQGMGGLLNGQINIMSVISTGLSGYSAYVGLLAMGLTGPQALIAIAVVVALAILKHFLISHFGKKENQSLGAGDAPTITAPASSSTGWLGSLPSSSVVYLTSGLALMSLGINLSATAPAYQMINVPAVALPQLQKALASASGNSSLPANPTGDVFVLQGTPGQPTRAVILEPSTQGGDTAQVVTLDANGNIIGNMAPSNAYVPFYQYTGKGATGLKQTQVSVNALYAQKGELALSQSQKLSAADQGAAANLAAAANKLVVGVGQ